MIKMTSVELFNLKHGDRVYRFNVDGFRQLDYVGRMPKSERYLIFSCGEYLTHLYISPVDESFRCDWYMGEYDSIFVGNLKMENLKEKMKIVQQVYLDND